MAARKRVPSGLAASLRAQGCAWTQIAAVIRELDRSLSPRAAMRLAHGWSQQEAAREWNRRWPDDPKADTRFSEWESWPVGGHAPSFRALARLAEMYQCSVADLLSDCPDFRARDSNYGALWVPTASVVAGGVQLPGVPWSLSAVGTAAVLERLTEADTHELARMVTAGAFAAGSVVNRREILLKLSGALALAAASPLLDVGDPDDKARLAHAVVRPERLDQAALDAAERALRSLRRQGDELGPEAALPAVMAQHRAIGRIAVSVPARLRQRTLTLYAQLNSLLGWMLLESDDYSGARHYYERARVLAHEAENDELAAYIAGATGQRALSQGDVRTALEQAVLAQTWAEHAGTKHARAYAAHVGMRAHLKAGRQAKAERLLDVEYAALSEPDQAEPAPWWYFFDSSYFWGARAQFQTAFGDPATAVETATHAVETVDPANNRDHVLRQINLSEAYVRADEPAAACHVLAQAARLATGNTSCYIAQRLGEVRTSLAPWDNDRHVRELDVLLGRATVSTKA